MSIPRSVAEVLREHVVLEVEALDRMYLNVYVPHLQSVGAWWVTCGFIEANVLRRRRR
jgi:ABC-type transport system involved in cytochrome bd biosynthesis fused ATPase/permease subunit